MTIAVSKKMEEYNFIAQILGLEIVAACIDGDKLIVHYAKAQGVQK